MNARGGGDSNKCARGGGGLIAFKLQMFRDAGSVSWGSVRP